MTTKNWTEKRQKKGENRNNDKIFTNYDPVAH